ncbi:MAG TPA: hypothetical protein VMT70_02655 [Vicinamibacteria bacterium]|nr:hypothetical protein [Vicinamibacteria bacterium]
MADVTRVAGTSAGAITATLVAVGCSAQDIRQIVGGTSRPTPATSGRS